MTDYSLGKADDGVEIGREFGGRHHSTVLHSINRIEVMRRTDDAMNRAITRLVVAVVAQT